VQFFHGIQARFDLGNVDRRREQAAAKEPTAHASAGAVEDVEERGFFGFSGEQWLDEFQIADGSGIENERVSSIVKGRPLQMVEGRALGVAEIVQDRSGGARGKWTRLQTAAVKGE
jgi:hypothetical protein